MVSYNLTGSTACCSDTGHSNLTFTVLPSEGLKSEQSEHMNDVVFVDTKWKNGQL